MRPFTRIIPFCVLAACASQVGETPTPRLLVLQYTRVPTSDDSAAVVRLGAHAVTIYPLIDVLTAVTAAPTTTFDSLGPAFRWVSTVDSLGCANGYTYIDFSTKSAATPDDSAFVASKGLPIDFVPWRFGPGGSLQNSFEAKVTPASFAAINELGGDTSIVAAYLDNDCSSVSVRRGHQP